MSAAMASLAAAAVGAAVSAGAMGWLWRRERATLHDLIDAIDGDLLVPAPQRAPRPCPVAGPRTLSPLSWAVQ